MPGLCPLDLIHDRPLVFSQAAAMANGMELDGEAWMKVLENLVYLETLET